MSKSKFDNALRVLIPFLLFAAVLLVCMESELNPLDRYETSGLDSSVFRYIGWAMSKGKVPYRDVFDHKGPVLYLINYLEYLISSEYGTWIGQVLTVFVTELLAYKLARRFTGRLQALAVTLASFALLNIYYAGGNLSEDYAMPFQILSLGIFIDFFYTPERYLSPSTESARAWANRRIMLCGVCFGAVFLLRANMISVWMTFCVGVAVVCIDRKQYKEIGRFIIWFVLGFALLAVPFLIYFLANNAFSDFMFDYFKFNFVYTTGGDATSFSAKLNWLFLYKSWHILLSFLVILVAFFIDKPRRLFHIFYLLFILLTLTLICMPGRPYEHYGMTLLPALIYPLAYLSGRLDKMKGMGRIVALAIAMLLILPNWYSMTERTDAVVRQYIRDDVERPAYLQMVDYIRENTDEDDTMTVYGNTCAYYILSGRLSASKYAYQPASFTQLDNVIMDEYFAELEAAPPKIVLTPNVDDRLSDFLENNGYALSVSYPWKIFTRADD